MIRLEIRENKVNFGLKKNEDPQGVIRFHYI
jgi:hypothetical protein